MGGAQAAGDGRRAPRCRDPDALRGALRPEDKRWPDWIKGQTKKIEGALAQLEAEVNSLKGKPTIGTISVACALGYLDYRFAAMDWRAKHLKLAKWFNSTAETPAMKATGPPAA